MEISLGIITYKDRDIRNLLASINKQKLQHMKIKEIIIVCAEKDRKHIEALLEKSSPEKISILTEKDRKGKYMAINLFLKEAKSDILVMTSGDIVLHEYALENICRPLANKKTGITAARPVPLNTKKQKLLGFTVELLWELHHIISLKKPKYGELIAFRNISFRLPRTAVDEETIASKLYSEGFKGKYVEEAIIYNKGPETVQDYLMQRRRIYCGHMQLRKKRGYTVPTLDNFEILEHLLRRRKTLVNPVKTFYAVLLEATARILGYLDYVIGRDYSVWKMIKK